MQVLKHQNLKKNEVLFRIGDLGAHFYIILKGAVSISINLPNQNDSTKYELKEVNILNQGASFGELALINDNV